MIRQIFFYGDYFEKFYEQLNDKIKLKFDFVLNLIANIELVPEKFLKHLEGTEGLYEIRVKVSRNIFRVFCFFDEERLIILLNAYQKKSQRTPKREIFLAEKLKRQYLLEKLKGEYSNEQ